MKEKLKYLLHLVIRFLAKLLSTKERKIPYVIVALVGFLIVYGSISLFVELTQNLQSPYLTNLDASVTKFITSFRTEALTSFFVIITDVGDVYGYLIVLTILSLLLFYYFKSWKFSLKLITVLSLTITSNIFLKQIINRQRPTIEHLVTVKTLSYPSGHAMTAMAFYGFLIYLIFSLKISKLLKFFWIFLCLFMIASIGISRVYLGVHYPTDIIGAYIAGFFWVIFFIMISYMFKTFTSRIKQRKAAKSIGKV